MVRRTWQHGVNGQAQVIQAMQELLASSTLLQDKAGDERDGRQRALVIAAGVRDFQGMLEELGKLQRRLPRDAPVPDEPDRDD